MSAVVVVATEVVGVVIEVVAVATEVAGVVIEVVAVETVVVVTEAVVEVSVVVGTTFAVGASGILVEACVSEAPPQAEANKNKQTSIPVFFTPAVWHTVI
ncbi:MAG: hypothetical protein QF837_05220 [Acidimicrobiales bacterium]|nr:hypothetical protein [Acidimicrobiaceae bacterium]MDP6162064.1 hypothetical protein [Acidimicrobiales bacterium]MDP6286012.1 hypothetical protein [Acidimicrobiales bacterium]HJL91048.1 hypothetical protein [Acidimicrobiales bacterium]HJO40037.1 hypothetical protein [Acidimicrobiales bacterium]